MKKTILSLLVWSLTLGLMGGCRGPVGPPGPEGPSGTISGKVYVSNMGEDKISVIDIATLTEIKKVEVGADASRVEMPHNVITSNDGRYWYITLTQAQIDDLPTGEVWKYRTSDDSFVAKVAVGVFPSHTVLSPDGQRAYVPNYDAFHRDMNSTVQVIDTETMTVVKTVGVGAAPHGARITHDGQYVYIACTTSDEVAVISTSDNELFRLIPIADDPGDPGFPKYQPWQVAISPDDQYAYVTCLTSGEVRRIDIRSNVVIDSVGVGDLPYQLEITRDGNYLYVANLGSNDVSVIFAHTMTLVKTIPVGENAHGVDITPDDRYAFVTCEGNHIDPGSVSVIDILSNTEIASITVGVYPIGVSVTPGRGN
ncbi:MAG: beta-propeller fold lactonase family protein [bacterium]